MHRSFFDFKIYELGSSVEIQSSGPENTAFVYVGRQSDFDMHRALIEKIFAAIGIEMDTGVRRLLLPDNAQIKLTEHLDAGAVYVFAFGLTPDDLGMNMDARFYKFYYTETFTILYSNSLEELSGKPQFKANLWAQLQKVFKDKKK